MKSDVISADTPIAVLLVQEASRLTHQIIDHLAGMNYKVLGPVGTPQAVRVLLNDVSVSHALIDCSLDRFVCRRVTEILNERGIPYFVFAS